MFAAGTPEQRLVRLLQEGKLRAAHTFGTVGPVLCVSEPSQTALQVMLKTGVTWRGAYAPWAVLLDRVGLINAGFRPVWHMSPDELAATSTMPARLRDRRIRYVPGSIDWLAEREWRQCWGDTPLAHDAVPALDLTGLLVGVIVGQPGWMPPPATTTEGSATWRRYASSCHTVPRLWWNGERLVDDGVFDLERQMQEDAMYDGMH